MVPFELVVLETALREVRHLSLRGGFKCLFDVKDCQPINPNFRKTKTIFPHSTHIWLIWLREQCTVCFSMARLTNRLIWFRQVCAHYAMSDRQLEGTTTPALDALLKSVPLPALTALNALLSQLLPPLRARANMLSRRSPVAAPLLDTASLLVCVFAL